MHKKPSCSRPSPCLLRHIFHPVLFFGKRFPLIRRDKLSNLKTAVFQPSLPGPGSGYKNTCFFRENHDRSDIALSSGNTFLLTDLNGAVYNQSPGISAGRIHHTRMVDGHG